MNYPNLGPPQTVRRGLNLQKRRTLFFVFNSIFQWKYVLVVNMTVFELINMIFELLHAK